MKELIEKVKTFFATTKAGHQIKSSLVTFTGIFFGMLVLTPAYNAVFEADLPTIQEFKDLWPVLIDTLYRSIWALILVQLGLYKYSSSNEEINKPIIK